MNYYRFFEKKILPANINLIDSMQIKGKSVKFLLFYQVRLVKHEASGKSIPKKLLAIRLGF